MSSISFWPCETTTAMSVVFSAAICASRSGRAMGSQPARRDSSAASCFAQAAFTLSYIRTAVALSTQTTIALPA